MQGSYWPPKVTELSKHPNSPPIPRAVDLGASGLGTPQSIQLLLLLLQPRPIYAFLFHGKHASKPYLCIKQLHTVCSLSRLVGVKYLA